MCRVSKYPGCVCVLSCSVLSSSLRSRDLQPSRLLYPWDFSGKTTGVSCHFLLQRIFLTQGWNLHLQCLLNCRCILYHQYHLILYYHRANCYTGSNWVKYCYNREQLGKYKIGRSLLLLLTTACEPAMISVKISMKRTGRTW